MYSNNIVNFQESTTILNAYTEKSGNLLKAPRIYIYIERERDASGWVISDISFGFTGAFGSCNISPPRPNDPVGIDLMPTPIPAANLRIFHTRQMTVEMALFMGITFEFWQQPIRTWLL